MEWKEINSFAPWLSAFGTWFAAWTALRLARRSDKAQVVFDAEYGSKYPNIDGAFQDIVIRATNIGRRSIRVTGIFWEAMSFTWTDHPILPDPNDPDRFRRSTRLPNTLKEGESLEIFLNPEKVGSDFIDQRIELWVAFFATRSLRMVVELADGTVFSGRPSKQFRQLLFIKNFGNQLRWHWLLKFV